MEKRHPNHPGEMSTDAQPRGTCASDEIGARARAIELLNDAGVPFVVGGAYAYATYTGIYRDTKDLDLFPRKRDAARARGAGAGRLAHGAQRTRCGSTRPSRASTSWTSSSGPATASRRWTTRGSSTQDGHGVRPPVPDRARRGDDLVARPSSYERERYDGGGREPPDPSGRAGDGLGRLIGRFERYWEVLLSHLMMFRFAYPASGTRARLGDGRADAARTLETLGEGRSREERCAAET